MPKQCSAATLHPSEMTERVCTTLVQCLDRLEHPPHGYEDFRADLMIGHESFSIRYSDVKGQMTKFLSTTKFSFNYDRTIYRPCTRLFLPLDTDPEKVPGPTLWHLPRIALYFYLFNDLPLIQDFNVRWYNTLISKTMRKFFSVINPLLRHDAVYDVSYGQIFPHILPLLKETYLGSLEAFMANKSVNIFNVVPDPASPLEVMNSVVDDSNALMKNIFSGTKKDLIPTPTDQPEETKDAD